MPSYKDWIFVALLAGAGVEAAALPYSSPPASLQPVSQLGAYELQAPQTYMPGLNVRSLELPMTGYAPGYLSSPALSPLSVPVNTLTGNPNLSVLMRYIAGPALFTNTRKTWPYFFHDADHNTVGSCYGVTQYLDLQIVGMKCEKTLKDNTTVPLGKTPSDISELLSVSCSLDRELNVDKVTRACEIAGGTYYPNKKKE